jgi:hypothetical protein
MILTTRRQRRVLAAMRSSLRDSDPRLVARFAVFTRLTADEEIPGTERVRCWPFRRLRADGRLIARHFTRPGLRPGKASPWLQGAVFIPLAAVLLLVVALLLAWSGTRTRCAPPRAGRQQMAPATVMPLPGSGAAHPVRPGPLGGEPGAACLFPWSRARSLSPRESVA